MFTRMFKRRHPSKASTATPPEYLRPLQPPYGRVRVLATGAAPGRVVQLERARD